MKCHFPLNLKRFPRVIFWIIDGANNDSLIPHPQSNYRNIQKAITIIYDNNPIYLKAKKGKNKKWVVKWQHDNNSDIIIISALVDIFIVLQSQWNTSNRWQMLTNCKGVCVGLLEGHRKADVRLRTDFIVQFIIRTWQQINDKTCF